MKTKGNSVGTKKMGLFERIINIILDILIFIFAVILVISIYNGIQVKVLGNDYSSFFGYSIFEVQTGSMEDTINIGDWIIVKYSKSIDLNDIITYEKDGEYITHRVIEVYKGTYITQGDANNDKDDPISKEQIVGEVVKILPLFGIFRKTLFNPGVLITLIITLYLFSFVFKKNKVDANGNRIYKNALEEKISKFFSNFGKKEQNTSNVLETNDETNSLDDIGEASLEDLIEVEPVGEPIAELNEVEDIKPKNKKHKMLFGKKKDSNPSNDIDTVNEDTISEIKENTEGVTEEDLDKTFYFRAISVDKSELDETYLEIEDNKMKEDALENKRLKASVKPEVVDDDDDNVSESLITSKLELLQNKKKKCKTVVEKTMVLKREELSEILDILNNNEKLKVNESPIRDSFLKAYVDAKYYNYCGNYNAEYTKNNVTYKLADAIKDMARDLSNKYKGNDTKYNEKVDKYCNIFLLIMHLEQAFLTDADIASKREFYRKKITKYNTIDGLNNDIIKDMTNKIIKVQRIYKGAVKFTLEKIDTSVFNLGLNQIGKKKIFGVELNHNIEFSKVYSDYIVDKTYSEGIIAEDKMVVLITLLSSKLIKDMLSMSFNNKYVFYIPDSLYEKETKFNKVLKIMDDEYTKNNVVILVRYDKLITNKKLLKNFRKEGYRFAIVFDKAVDIKAKDISCINIADYIFVDKKIASGTNILTAIPEDSKTKIISEDITNKVGDFGGE